MAQQEGYNQPTTHLHAGGRWIYHICLYERGLGSDIPQGDQGYFQRDTVICAGIHYVNLQDNWTVITMIGTVIKLMMDNTSKEIAKAILSHTS